MLDERPADLAPTPAPTPVSFQAQSGRWRTAARLARREMRRRPWRTALSLLLIAVPVAAMVAADVAYRTDLLPPDLDLVVGEADGVIIGGPALASSIDEVIDQLPDGARTTVARQVFAPLRSMADPEHVENVMVYVRDEESPLHTGRTRVVDGRAPAGSGEVLLGPDLAERWQVGVGDQLGLVRPAQVFTVVGIGYTSSLNTSGAESWSMVAPGFDLSVVRADEVPTEVLVDLPSSVGSVPPDPALPGLASVVVDTIDGATGEPTPTEYPFTSREWIDLGYDDPQPGELFLGWLGAVLLLGVTGVVVAAAFAVSGRRQLVTIGQLSATGADPTVLRRFLALQGTVTGVVAAITGVLGGLVAVRLLRPVMATDDDRLAWHPADLTLLVVTAIVIATIAAIVPTRSLASSSVLAALAGRRPVPPVRARQVSLGLGLLASGLLVLFLATAAAQTSGDEIVSGAAAVLAAIAVLVGVCCLCPVAVDRVAALGAGRRGSVRLAARALGRHRARSAALLASIVVVAAALIGISAVAEQVVADDAVQSEELARQDPHVLLISASDLGDVEQVVYAIPRVDPELVRDDLRATVEAHLGRVTWTEAAVVQLDDQGEALVVDDAVLAAMGVPTSARDEVVAAGAVTFDPTSHAWAGGSFWCCPPPGAVDGLPTVRSITLDGLRFGYGALLLTEPVAASLGRETVPMLVAVSAEEPRSEQIELLRQEIGWNWEQQVFTDLGGRPDTQVEFQWMGPVEHDDWIRWFRLGTVIGALALMALIVTIGMALWAAEGRDERDALVAVGAGPAVLARTAAWKASMLTVTGAGLGLPLGWLVVRIVASAANVGHVPFPWWFTLAALTVVPVVITFGAWAASAVGQRARPVTASTMSD